MPNDENINVCESRITPAIWITLLGLERHYNVVAVCIYVTIQHVQSAWWHVLGWNWSIPRKPTEMGRRCKLQSRISCCEATLLSLFSNCKAVPCTVYIWFSIIEKSTNKIYQHLHLQHLLSFLLYNEEHECCFFTFLFEIPAK